MIHERMHGCAPQGPVLPWSGAPATPLAQAELVAAIVSEAKRAAQQRISCHLFRLIPDFGGPVLYPHLTVTGLVFGEWVAMIDLHGVWRLAGDRMFAQ